MKRLILPLLPVLALLAGCLKQEAYTYSGVEAGTLSSGVFTSDNGTQMTIVGNEEKYDISSSRRVLISFETRTTTNSGPIDIDLLGLLDAHLLQSQPVDVLPVDPSGSLLQISDAWFSKDYLNILASFPGKDIDKHTFTTSYSVSEKGISIRIDHDGSQDTAAGNDLLSVFLCVSMREPVQSYDQYDWSTSVKPPYPISILLQWTDRPQEGGSLALLERKGSYLPPTAN